MEWDDCPDSTPLSADSRPFQVVMEEMAWECGFPGVRMVGTTFAD